MPLLENEEVIERGVHPAEQHGIVKRYTEKAIRFVREHKDGPFFLYWPHSAVHFPHYPAKEYIGRSPNGLLGDWVEEVDWSVGQLFRRCRAEFAGADARDLYVDNGGPVGQGARNGPLAVRRHRPSRGAFASARLPGGPEIPAGTSTDAITTMMDILPTLAGLAGASVGIEKSTASIFGRCWRVPRGRSRRGKSFSITAGWRWKLCGRDRGSCIWRRRAIKRGKRLPRRTQLYNLADDIGEAKNVAAAARRRCRAAEVAG